MFGLILSSSPCYCDKCGLSTYWNKMRRRKCWRMEEGGRAVGVCVCVCVCVLCALSTRRLSAGAGVGLCVRVGEEVSSHSRYAAIRSCSVCACPALWGGPAQGTSLPQFLPSGSPIYFLFQGGGRRGTMPSSGPRAQGRLQLPQPKP